jgi:phosphotriesterase-related protein
MGRDPALVARAAAGTGLTVMFATGLHVRDGLPPLFPGQEPGSLATDDGQLEALFERDLAEGMAGTGVRAAVLGVVTGPKGLAGDDGRLARAVASVSARTGAVICTQADALSRRGLDQQQLFARHGVHPGRVLIGGCAETADLDYAEALIAAGSYIGWDACGQSIEVPPQTQLDRLAELCWRGHAGRIMLSHGRPSFTDHRAGAPQSLALSAADGARAHTAFLRGLRDRGVPDQQIEQMLTGNPRDFLAQGQPAAAAAAPGAPAPARAGALPQRATAVLARPASPGRTPRGSQLAASSAGSGRSASFARLPPGPGW